MVLSFILFKPSTLKKLFIINLKCYTNPWTKFFSCFSFSHFCIAESILIFLSHVYSVYYYDGLLIRNCMQVLLTFGQDHIMLTHLIIPSKNSSCSSEKKRLDRFLHLGVWSIRLDYQCIFSWSLNWQKLWNYASHARRFKFLSIFFRLQFYAIIHSSWNLHKIFFFHQEPRTS